MISVSKKLSKGLIPLQILLWLFILCFQGQGLGAQASNGLLASEAPTRLLKGGWYPWDPYQYLKVPGDNGSLTGLDVELEKIILQKAGFPDMTITPISWKQHQEDLKTGGRDFAMGAFYSKEREQYSYLAGPYRYEEDSFFVSRKDLSAQKYENVKEFLRFIKKNNLKVGVVSGYRYASDEINDFVADPTNKNNIVGSPTDNFNLSLLLNGKLDGFLADRIVGATIIWREQVGRQVGEKRLDVKAPIYMLLGKKSFSPSDVKSINDAITAVKNSSDYTRTVSWYLYPILLLETTDSDWFIFIEIIGTIAFALSGLVVGYRCNASLFGTFILCLLPSFGGGLLRDIICGRYPVWFMMERYYLILIIALSVVGFFGIKLFKRYSRSQSLSKKTQFFDILLTITDAAGLAAFTVTGVLVSLIAKSDPLWLWGPFFAFLTGAGGGTLRDILVQDVKHTAPLITGGLYAEVAVFWGFMLSLYLSLTTSDVDPLKIKIAVILTIVFSFITRVSIYFFNIPNVYVTSNAQPIKGSPQ
jgi:polar amino acid transport system substrate-binding protein